MDEIYFDNAATTKVDEKVLKAMNRYFLTEFGNASSLHDAGQKAKESLEEARKIIADSINARPSEIIFTSGGTEGNNFALKGLFFANPGKKHIITTKIEHDCIINSVKWLEKQGARTTYLDVDEEGFVDLGQLKKAITPDTLVVSVIHGNNEIGTIQNLEEIGKVCKSKGVYFHTDACQSYTKTEIDVEKQILDLATLNAHKIHGPKGVGALFIRKGVKIEPLIHGGGQEKELRSGTENISGIVGFAEAVKIAKREDVNKMRVLRDTLISEIEKIPEAKLNGSREDKRLCNNINFSFKGVEGESIVALLNQEGIATSTGSACSSRSLEPSHVLTAMGLSHGDAHGSLRISLSKFNTEKEVEKVLKILPEIVGKLRNLSPTWRKR